MGGKKKWKVGKLTSGRNCATQGKARCLSLPPAFLPQTHPPFPVCPPYSVSATTAKISQTFYDKFL